MEHKSSKPFRIAIIGGGMGGLCFAIALARSIPDYASRIDVDIYESTSSLEGQVGAGIVLYAYTWGILEYLGVDKELAKHTKSIISDEPLPFFKIRRSDRREGQDLFTLQSKAGGAILFHRGDLQSVLLRNLPSSFRIHTKKRLRTYSQDQDEVMLYFEDGTTAACDFAIGADGLQSNTRRALLQEVLQVKLTDNPQTKEEEYIKRLCTPYWTGSIIYRGLISTQQLKEAGLSNHEVFTSDLLNVGNDGSIITYIVSGGTAINFAALKSWPDLDGSVYSDKTVDELLGHAPSGDTRRAEEKALVEERNSVYATSHNDRDPWAENGGGGMTSSGRARWVHRVENHEVKAAFKNWEEDMQVLIDHVGKPLQWAIHANHPLPTFRSGKVCLLGDAAHAMPPFLGQGTGQAVSDGLVLAKLFGTMMEDRSCDPRAQLDDALSAYDEVRRPIAQRMSELSRDHGHHWFLRTKDAAGQLVEVDTNNKKQVDALCESMTRNWGVFQDKKAPFEEAENAIKVFKRRISDQVQS